MQISQKPPQRHWDGAREPAVLTCFQAMLMLLVLGPHLRTPVQRVGGWGLGGLFGRSPWLFILLHSEDSFLDGV